MKPRVNRRDFLKTGAVGVGAAILTGCKRPRRWVTLEPYVRPPEEQLSGVATWYASTCRQCPAGCGIIVRIMNGRALKIEGNPGHPLNQGKLCARGQAGLQVLYNPDRLSGPVQQNQRGSRAFQSLSWDAALNTLYTQLQGAGNAVAIWGGSVISGHLLDLFQRFTSAVQSPAPLIYDLYTAWHGYHLLSKTNRDLFGQDGLPVYDLSGADIVFSFGADFLGTWLSAVRYGVGYGDFRGQKLGERGYLVQLEPRMTTTGVKADRWYAIRPGSEGLIAQALVGLIADQGVGPSERIAAARNLASGLDYASAAQASDVPLAELQHLAHIFATAEHPLAIPGTAITGLDHPGESLAAVQALNLVASADQRPTGFFIDGGSTSTAIIQPQVSPLSDVQQLIAQMQAGKIRVLMIHGANPAYDLPQEVGFVEALKQVPFVVSFAPIVDETALWADLIMPDHTYLESWGYAPALPSFETPVIGSLQPVVKPYFDTRATGDVMLAVAKGFPQAAEAMPWVDEVAFLKDTIGQLPPGAAGGSGGEVLWARFRQHGGWWSANVPAPSPPAAIQAVTLEAGPAQFQGEQRDYPFYLHPVMTVFLSDGRGADQPWLQGSPDPMTTMSWQTWVEIHPDTAKNLRLKDGDIVRVSSVHGELEALVLTYPGIRPDTVAVPLGQGHTDYGRYARDMGSNPVAQLLGGQTDSSGQYLVWANLRVNLTPTGKRSRLAIFENKVGVSEGFINQAFPGQ
jgi:anaerobic selenocysteine-containing dehydrogenase